MTRPLRDKDPEIFRLITIRTEGARLWMKPNKRINKVIAGILARYSSIFNIEIYAFTFLSNHYHLLIKAPLANADEFEENLNREIARRVNWINHRAGKFWARRYDDQPILNEEDLLEAFLYITTNAVRHGLVQDPAIWPGFSSYKMSLSETPHTYSFNHYSAENEENRVTYHTLKITPLPQFSDLKKQMRVEKIELLIKERTFSIVEDRKANGQGFLNPETIREQDPNDVPKVVSRSPRPHCYSKSPAVIRDYRKHLLARRDLYTNASARYRLGDMNALFPEYTFKPPLHRKPRLAPFKPLQDDYFKNAA